MIERIQNQEFGGERPLYSKSDLELQQVTVHPGESSVKHGKNIHAFNCRFEGKYVFWENDHLLVEDSLFTPSARSSVWYSRDVTYRNCRVEAPKMFRRVSGIHLDNVEFPDAQEMFWDCDHIKLHKVRLIGADYAYMHSTDIDIEDYYQEGNYSFQLAKRVVIRNAVLHSKDALWESEDCTLIDCELDGEFLAWYSKNLKLVRCRIKGGQPLCYCENLTMEDCILDADCERPFEYSTVNGIYTGMVPW